MTIKHLKEKNLLLFECIAGSRAYGTNVDTSDTDIKGVFILPKNQFYGLDYIPQVNDEKNDQVFYEIGRFIDLLLKNNPNMLELLAMPEDCILLQKPVFKQINPALFISKLCEKTFAGYAMAQIKKARGLNKKIVNPIDKKRKNIMDFCYVTVGQGSIPLKDWLTENRILQQDCGLVKVSHCRDLYAVFHQPKNTAFKGIMQKENSNEVSLSSIPKGMSPLAYLSFNKDGYQVHCKDHKAYWEWVEHRNESRYENTIAHGKNYDTKNMLHTFRLLDMAAEIAQHKSILVRRPNPDFLLKIRKGFFQYEDLLDLANERLNQIHSLYEKADLPEHPDKALAKKLLVKIRETFYNNH